MSWDIFVQDLPDGIERISDIPPDFAPGLIGRRLDVINTIKRLVPAVEITNPAWIVVENEDVNFEVGLGDEEELMSFAFHVHGGGGSARLIYAILSDLGLRALDPSSDDGIFHGV